MSAPRAMTTLRWTRLDWDNQAATFPPHGEPVLMCDEIGCMAVCTFDRASNDALLLLDHLARLDLDVAYDSDGNEFDVSEQTVYFQCPIDPRVGCARASAEGQPVRRRREARHRGARRRGERPGTGAGRRGRTPDGAAASVTPRAGGRRRCRPSWPSAPPRRRGARSSSRHSRCRTAGRRASPTRWRGAMPIPSTRRCTATNA